MYTKYKQAILIMKSRLMYLPETLFGFTYGYNAIACPLSMEDGLYRILGLRWHKIWKL